VLRVSDFDFETFFVLFKGRKCNTLLFFLVAKSDFAALFFLRGK
jgi:hypothetical protein